MTSKYFYLNDNFLLEYIYNSEVVNTSVSGFRKLVNQHDSRNYVFSKDIAYPNNINILDKMFTVVNPITGKYVSLDQDLVTSYNDYDPELTDTGDLDVDLSGYDYDVQYDTIRIHFRSGYTFDDSEGFYLDARFLTKSPYDAVMAAIQYRRYDNYKKYHVVPFLLGDSSYDSYVDIKIPSLQSIKQEEVNYPGNPNKLYHIISNGVGINQNANLQLNFGEISRVYIETVSLNISTTADYTFFEFKPEHQFAINPIDQYSEVYASIVEEAPENGDYILLQAMYNGNAISDYISYLNSQLNSNWVIIHDITIFEQIGTLNTQSSQYSFIQNSNYDKPYLFRPVLENSHAAVSYTIQYQIRVYNQITQEQIVKTAQFSSNNCKKYGKKLTRIDMGIVPTIDKIYNKIQTQQIKFDTSKMLQPTFKTEKFVISYYDSSNICVSVGNMNDSIFDNDPNNIKKQGESIIKINDIDTYLKFNIYELLNGSFKNKNLNGVGEMYLTFIDNNGGENKIVQLFDDQFNPANGEAIFKIQSDKAKEIIKYTNSNYYITVVQSNRETVLYTGSWVYTKDQNLNSVVLQNLNKDNEIAALKKQLSDLQIKFDSKNTELLDSHQKIADLAKVDLSKINQITHNKIALDQQLKPILNLSQPVTAIKKLPINFTGFKG